MKKIWELIRNTFTHATAKNTSRMGAALAYYTTFSLAPLLLIFISVVGLYFSKTYVLESLSHGVSSLFGSSVGEYVIAIARATNAVQLGVVGTILSIAVVIYGALSMFGELSTDLNELWKVETKKKIEKQIGVQIVISFCKEKGLQFLLLVALATIFMLTLLVGIILARIPMYSLLANAGLFFLSVVTFALIYRILPNSNLPWSEIWLGSLVTSVLFFIGRLVIGYYLREIADISVYGAAGSLAVILIWIYYSARVFFFGASFIFVHSRQNGVLSSTQ